MRALNPSQRRFAMAAVMYPLAKDWQIAKAAGYSDRSHGSLRVAAHRLFHDEGSVGDPGVRGQGGPVGRDAGGGDDQEDSPKRRAQGSVQGRDVAGRA
jgi:hypothetical protein